MYIKNMTGPILLPCMTPLSKLINSDSAIPTLVCCKMAEDRNSFKIMSRYDCHMLACGQFHACPLCVCPWLSKVESKVCHNPQWKRHLGRSSCLAVLATATPVGDERGSTAHLWPASLRPHLRRTHQPPLAPSSGESTVQDGHAHVQGHSWNCAIVPESTGSCRRSTWLAFPRSTLPGPIVC